MKKIILSLFVIFWGLYSYSQENDTTKINLGETKIIIIEKGNNEGSKTNKNKLEEGKTELEKMQNEKQALLDEQRKQLEEMKKMLEQQTDEAKKQEIEIELQKNEVNLTELEKEVEALEKGIDDIERDLDVDDDWDNDTNDHGDNNYKNKYDWEFKNKFPKHWDNMNQRRKDKKFRGNWAGVELGFNNYVNKDFSSSLDPDDRLFELSANNSWVFAINFVEINIPFGKNLGLVTGLGTSWNNYQFRKNVNVFEDSTGIIVAELELEKKYYKNTLNTWSFSLPLIFEFQIPISHKKPGIYGSFGIVGSVKVMSVGKQYYKIGGEKYKDETQSDFLMNNFRYGLTARIGFKQLRFFANYDLVPLFQKDRGPELYPISIGVTLLSF